MIYYVKNVESILRLIGTEGQHLLHYILMKDYRQKREGKQGTWLQ